MIATWPTANVSLEDETIEARFARFSEVLKGLREIRSRQSIPPKTNIEFSVRTDGATVDLLKPMAPYFQSLAGAMATAWGADIEPPTPNATFNLPGIDVYVDLKGLIDVEAEIDRTKKELAKLESLIAGKENKLANKNFVERAPAEVVQKERENLEELRQRVVKSEAALAELQNLA